MVRTGCRKRNGKVIQLKPPQSLALSFAVIILFGTLLLKLPAAAEKPVSWIDAFFTAASATTVTGLATVDIGSTYTIFGQVVILVLVQLGGLGFMTFAVLGLMMLGRKIGLKHRILIQEAFNQASLGGLIRLVRTLFLFTVSVEAIAFIILSERWVPEFGWGKGMYYSLFHTVTAFNNAGFSIWPDNLIRYAGDPVVNIVISGLLIIGGIGFTVLVDIRNKRSFRSLTLHTKLVLIGTLGLNAAAMLLFFILEYGNPGTLGHMSLLDKLWGAYFQAVSPRTAGFNTVPIDQMSTPSILIMCLLMFIGAGSASTASGIKITTFIVVLLATISFLSGKGETTVFKRTIKRETVVRSLAIIVISTFFIMLCLFALTVTEHQSFLGLLFEALSAFGTVGLTLNVTPHLTFAGKIIIIMMMFIGRVGPLTIAFMFSRKKKESKVKYPTEDIITG